MTSAPRPDPSPVVVVGGGITGTVVARRVARAGIPVVLVESDRRLGGQLHTASVAGMPAELGAEALYLGLPQMRSLLDELDLTRHCVTAATGATWLSTPRGLRRLPAGVGPAGPTRLRPVLRSRVLSPIALLRAGIEPIMARRPVPGEPSVAAFVDHRFGPAVTAAFVDPMMGSLHAGDIRRLSLPATSPLLAAANAGRRSLLAGTVSTAGAGRVAALRGRLARAPGGTSAGPPGTPGPAGPTPAGPVFATLPTGLQSLPEQVLAGTAVGSRLGQTVSHIERLDPAGDPGDGAARFRVRLVDVDGNQTETLTASAVVLAIPAPAAAALVAPLAPDSARALAEIPMASVATMVLAYPRAVLAAHEAFAGTGILLPSNAGRTMKAAVFLSSKWPHLAGADGDLALVRVSAGRAGSDLAVRAGDDELLAGVRADLAELTGLTAEPAQVLIRRWPLTMAQLELGHAQRLARARALPAGLFLAGASYEGVGVTSCLRSAQTIAEATLASVQGRGMP